jgi:RNA polymerase sigma-70 factor (ECF subfamily)
LAEEDTDDQALTVADLYQELEEGLHRYARNLTLDADRSDDLVQMTFIKAMAHLELLRRLNRYQRRAWLYQTLKNLFLDQLRTQLRERRLAEQLHRAALIEAQTDQSLALSYGLLEAVPEKYHDLLYQRYVLEMTSEEIGQRIGVPAATIRSRLHLAIQWLRTHQSEF